MTEPEVTKPGFLNSWRTLLLTWIAWSIFGVLCMNTVRWWNAEPVVTPVALTGTPVDKPEPRIYGIHAPVFNSGNGTITQAYGIRLRVKDAPVGSCLRAKDKWEWEWGKCEQ